MGRFHTPVQPPKTHGWAQNGASKPPGWAKAQKRDTGNFHPFTGAGPTGTVPRRTRRLARARKVGRGGASPGHPPLGG